MKRVALELGGKSANVILPDADLERAVTSGITMCFLNSGQTCIALSRMLVPREKLAEAETIAARVAESFKAGNPFEDSTRLGPLVSAAHREQVRAHIRQGMDEGAKLVTGGLEPPEGLETGFFVRPTVFSEVRPDMTIAQEEIFGPVLSMIPYASEDEAVIVRERLGLRALGSRVVGGPQPCCRRRAPDPHGTSRHKRGTVQPVSALRRLQAVGPWARAREIRTRGIPRDEVTSALATVFSQPSTPIPGPARARRRNWQRIRFVVGIALGAVALWAVSNQKGELAGASVELSHLDVGWLLVAIAVEALSLVAFARLDQRLLRCGGVRAGTGRFTVISFAAGAIASSLPAGPLVASAFGFRQFRRLGASEALAAWALLATLVFSALGLALLATAGVVIAEREGSTFDLIGVTVAVLADHDRRRSCRLRAAFFGEGIRDELESFAPTYGFPPPSW